MRDAAVLCKKKPGLETCRVSSPSLLPLLRLLVVLLLLRFAGVAPTVAGGASAAAIAAAVAIRFDALRRLKLV